MRDVLERKIYCPLRSEVRHAEIVGRKPPKKILLKEIEVANDGKVNLGWKYLPSKQYMINILYLMKPGHSLFIDGYSPDHDFST
jgi:hypothetical protein